MRDDYLYQNFLARKLKKEEYWLYYFKMA
jgi:hypothetical protein